jgi:hypothetical protein
MSSISHSRLRARQWSCSRPVHMDSGWNPTIWLDCASDAAGAIGNAAETAWDWTWDKLDTAWDWAWDTGSDVANGAWRLQPQPRPRQTGVDRRLFRPQRAAAAEAGRHRKGPRRDSRPRPGQLDPGSNSKSWRRTCRPASGPGKLSSASWARMVRTGGESTRSCACSGRSRRSSAVPRGSHRASESRRRVDRPPVRGRGRLGGE